MDGGRRRRWWPTATVELGALFEEARGGGARCVAAPLKGASAATFDADGARSRCARGARARKGSRALLAARRRRRWWRARRSASSGRRRRASSMASAAPSPNCPRRARWSSPSTLPVGADAADRRRRPHSRDGAGQVRGTSPALSGGHLPPLPPEPGRSTRRDRRAPAATTRDLAERVLAPLTAASGSRSRRRSAARARDGRGRVHGSLGAVRGPADTGGRRHRREPRARCSLRSMHTRRRLASLTNLSCFGSTCSSPLSHRAAPPPGGGAGRPRSTERRQVGSALLVLAPSSAVSQRDGRAALHGAWRRFVRASARAAHAELTEIPELRADLARNDVAGGARRLCARRRLSRRRAHRR